MPYSPAFQFYPAEYLGDKNTIPMTTLENGAYCLLMWVSWEQDGLPADLEELADIARMQVEDFEPIWNRRIKKCFIWDEKKNVFFHPRHLKEIKKQKAWKKENSERGRNAARSRWDKRGSDDASAMHTHADALHTHASSSLSSSSSLFPFSSSFLEIDLKRLIERACEKNSRKDPRLVEIAIIQTLLNRNGDMRPINSLAYFADEIKHMCSKSNGISPATIDVVLQRRREQIAKTLEGK